MNKKAKENTADPNGGTKLEEIRLREENLASIDTKLADLSLRELNLLPSLLFQ